MSAGVWGSCLLVLSTTLVCCANDKQTKEFIQVIVEVRDPENLPVEGAFLSRGGAELGRTDRQGRAQFQVESPGETEVSLESRCPEGYHRVGDGPLKVLGRSLRDLEGGELPTRLSFRCAKTKVEHVLVIRTGGQEGIPVLVEGEEKCRTDSQGIAQLVVSGPPARELRVVLNTASNPSLRPGNPSRLMKLPSTSRFLVFDQGFEVKKKKKRKGKRKRFAGPRRLR